MSDTNDVLFVYVRYTSDAGREVRVIYPEDASAFADRRAWKRVGTIQPRSFIESLLQDNEIIFSGVFPERK